MLIVRTYCWTIEIAIIVTNAKKYRHDKLENFLNYNNLIRRILVASKNLKCGKKSPFRKYCISGIKW